MKESCSNESVSVRAGRRLFEPRHEKPAFGICDKVRLKPACSATETSLSFEILDMENTGFTLSRKWTIMALIRLRGCVGWSAPLLFAYGKANFFQSWRGSFQN